MTIRGEWNNVMMAKPANGEEYLFIDVKAKPEMKKECVPVLQQGERESRRYVHEFSLLHSCVHRILSETTGKPSEHFRLWRHVTAALLRNRINIATTAKRMIEQRQRAEAKMRQERGERWRTRYFSLGPDDKWVFNEPLEQRL